MQKRGSKSKLKRSSTKAAVCGGKSNKSIKRKPCSWRTKVKVARGGRFGLCNFDTRDRRPAGIQGQGTRPLAALTQPGAATTPTFAGREARRRLMSGALPRPIPSLSPTVNEDAQRNSDRFFHFNSRKVARSASERHRACLITN